MFNIIISFANNYTNIIIEVEKSLKTPIPEKLVGYKPLNYYKCQKIIALFFIYYDDAEIAQYSSLVLESSICLPIK